MPIEQRVVVVVTSLLISLVIFELVRKRRLREEYSWLWLLAGALIAVAGVTPFPVLEKLANLMGSTNPPAAIFFLGFVGVTLLCLQFSVRLSRMTEQIKNLAQQVSLLEQAQEEARDPQRAGERSP